MSLQIQRPYKVGDWLQGGRHLRRGHGNPLGRDPVAHERRHLSPHPEQRDREADDHESQLPDRGPRHAHPGGRGLQRPAEPGERCAPPRRHPGESRPAGAAAESLPEGLRRILHPLRDQVQHDEPRVLQRSLRRHPHQYLVRIPPAENHHPLPHPHPATATQTAVADRRDCGRKRARMLRDEPLFSCLDDEQMDGLVRRCETSIISAAARR